MTAHFISPPHRKKKRDVDIIFGKHYNMDIEFSQSCVLPSTWFLFSLNLLLGTVPGGGAVLGVSLAGGEADRRGRFEIQTRESCTKAYRIYIVIQGGDRVKCSCSPRVRRWANRYRI